MSKKVVKVTPITFATCQRFMAATNYDQTQTEQRARREAKTNLKLVLTFNVYTYKLKTKILIKCRKRQI